MSDIANEKRIPDGIKKNGEPFNVMVVDDSVFIMKQLQQIFSSESYNVLQTAANGQEAVDKYKENHPNIDLVTLDITMPIKDGITALKEIVEFDSEARIIMISAIGKQDLVKEALQLGAKNYIVKPLNRSRVLERIRQVLA